MTYLSKENVEEVVTLSPLQEGLLEPTGGATAPPHPVVQVIYGLTPAPDAQRLQQALDHVIATHPTLRSVFRTVKNRTVQVFLKTRPIALDVHDLRTRGASEQRAALAQIAHGQEEPLNPAEDPPMRLAVVLVSDRQAFLVWTYDEVVVDETSRDHVLTDLLVTYDALLQGAPPPSLARRPYREYLGWLARQDFSRARVFWAEQLAGCEAPTPLLDGLHADQHGSSAARTLVLSEDLSASLTALAQRHGIPTGVVAQAAWAIVLGAYSHDEHVVFGLRYAARPTALLGAAEMVGRFANAAPVRVHLDGDCRLPEFLAEVHRVSSAPLAYVHASPAEIRGYAGLPVAESLFETCLGVHGPEASAGEGNALQATIKSISRRLDHGLALDVTLGRRWTLSLSGSADALGSSPWTHVLDHLHTLLAAMVAHPEARIADLDLLPAGERHQLLIGFNQSGPAVHGDLLVHEIFESQVRQRADAVAAVDGDGQITYACLNARANQLARCLRAQGVGRDDLVGLLASRGIDMLVGLLAVAKAGGAYVPLDADSPSARLKTIVSASRAKVLLVQNRFVQQGLSLVDDLLAPPALVCLDAAPSGGVVADATAWSALPADNLVATAQPGDLANVFYTSGSTGLPKGVMVEHRGMLNHLWSKVRLLALDDRSVVVQNASHCFDISVWQFLAPLMVGGRVIICDDAIASDPRALLATVQSSEATVLEVVPTMLEMVLQAAAAAPSGRVALPRLRHLLSTAEALPVPLCRAWLQAYPHVTLVNAYGPTECSDDVTHAVIATPPPADQGHVPVGTPIPGFNVYLLDRWHRPVPLGCVGEIFLTGAGVGRGYLHDAERTSHAFLRNPFDDGRGERMYRTGDLGRFLPDGRLVYLGRIDHQVKVRGRRIEPGEIEAVLLRHPGVQQSAVIAQKDARGQTRLLAFTVQSEDVDLATLRAFLSTLVPDYMIPDQIIRLDAFPLTRNGKVNRQALGVLAIPPRGGAATVAPRDEIEGALATIWQEVLDIPRVGIDESFFSLGGHSLQTVQVRSRLQQCFGVDVALRTLFEHQTIQELAPVIAELSRAASPAGQTTIPRLPRAAQYPMAHAQKRLWFLQQMEPHSAYYNLPSLLEIAGPLDLSTLHRAFETIVERQASLRTTFAVVDGQPMQRVAQQITWSCPVHDLSGLGEEERERALAEIVAANAGTTFDLEAGPLFRIGLVKVAPDRHVLMLTLHHIISDAWSAEVLEREFTTLYRAYSTGAENPLPPLSIEYTDYAHWQNQRLAGGFLEDDKRYWLTQLAGPLPVLHLPIDHARPPVQTYRGRAQDLALDPTLVENISALCRRYDATLFMGLLAATAALMRRLSGQDDIILGTPVAGRNQREVEDLIGFFVNTLPIRIIAGDDQSFQDLCAQIKTTALDAYTHQEYPFDQMVQEVNPRRDLSRSPIFSVMFQLQRDTRRHSHDGTTVRHYPEQPEHARFDLTITFIESADGLRCRFEYNADLFEAPTIGRMLQQMHTLLRSIIATPQQPLWELPLLPAAERRRVLTEWNSTAASYPADACLPRLLEDQVKRTPQAVAVTYQDVQLTYGELNRRANQLAHYLRRMGVGREDVVGICMERSPDMVIALLGVMKAGAAYLPLDPGYPAERLSFMLGDAAVPVLLTDQGVTDGLGLGHARVVSLTASQAVLDGECTANPDSGVCGANLAYVIYTSGSTGIPKGVQITHGSVVNFLHSMRRKPGLTDADTLVAVTSLSFDIAALELFLPLTVGAHVVLVGRDVASDGRRLASCLESSGATVMQATPSTWRLLLAAGWQPASRLAMLCGGEAMPGDLAEALAGHDRTLWNMYGPTETTIWSTVWPVALPLAGQPPIGRPIANTQIYLLDQHLQPVPIGVPGELYIGGAGLARGYRNRPELTAQQFIPHPFSAEPGARLYRTGDLARYQADGTIECLGRLDHQLKIRGYRIEAGEIEAVLAQHPGIDAAVVVARDDSPGDKRLVAYVVPRTGHTLGSGDLREYVLQKLPAYMVPSAFVSLETLPLTPNGKLDRGALPALEGVHCPTGHDYVAPRDAVEKAMTALWEEILHVRPIGVRDDFFSLGGHSLTAVMLMTVIRQRLDADLPLTVLFQRPTIAALCDHLRATTPSATGCVVPITPGGARPPLFLVHPQGGGVLCYLHLARALDQTPVYGIEADGDNSDAAPLPTIEAMARRYVEEIRLAAPHGPYRLAGWSFGGLVAFEMARLLEQQGEEVSFLGLIDTQAPSPSPSASRPRADDGERGNGALLEIATQQFGIERAELEGRDEEQSIALVLERAKALNLVPREAAADVVWQRVRMMTRNQVAMDSYRCPTPIRSAIHLFRVCTAEAGGQRALVDVQEWQPRTTGHVHDIPLPGTHHSVIQPPHVFALSEAMNAALQQEKEQEGQSALLGAGRGDAAVAPGPAPARWSPCA